MGQDWSKFRAKVEAELQPIVIQAGYHFVPENSGLPDEDDPLEGPDSFVFWYQKDQAPPIVIDALVWTKFEQGVIKYFNWLRVDIGAKRLRELMGVASETDIFLQVGWIWVTDEELAQDITEIAQGLNTHFKNQSK